MIEGYIMLHMNDSVSDKGAATHNRKPYIEPKLISRGDIASLTKGVGGSLLDADGTTFGVGNPS